MGDKPSPSESGRDRAASSLDSFLFTFNVSSTNSRGSSFIEPDHMADSPEDESRSLSESVVNFPTQFGRTYHAYREGSYAFPNDLPEQERLTLQNVALKKLFDDRLYFAPLDTNPPHSILDIATGIGDWAIEMGDRFPHAKVTATDLSPIQPPEVPPNVEFFVEDSSEEWTYTQKFDYVHTRSTAGCWSDYESQIVKQAFDALEPGGWFESQELDVLPHCDDGTLKSDSALARWFRDMIIAGETAERPLTQGCDIRDMYERVGFVDVHECVYKIPLNSWPKDEKLKEIGWMWQQNMETGLSGFTIGLFHRVLGRTFNEIQVSLVDVRHDLADTRIHAYLPIFVVWGRKPHPGEQPRARSRMRFRSEPDRHAYLRRA